MKRLSGLDNLFVMLDSERYPLHGAAIFVLDPSTAPKPFNFEVLRTHIAHLIPVLPPLRRRLVQVPFGLVAPSWYEDPDFDLDRHLHNIAVPAPGDDRQLAALRRDRPALPGPVPGA